MANHGQPCVTFPATPWRAGYELHGKAARDHYEALDKARAHLEALKVKLRGEGIKAQRGDETR